MLRRITDGSMIKLMVLAIFLLLCVEARKHRPQTPQCPPSSCGEIQNISFPFRLKSDPKQCGMPDCELSCENNQAVLELGRKRLRYHVKAITYENYSIRIVDPGLEHNHDCLSLPSQSLYLSYIFKTIFTSSRTHSFYRHNYYNSYDFKKFNNLVTYMRCAAAVVNSSFYIATTNSCSTEGSSISNLPNSNPMGNYSYMLYDYYNDMKMMDVPDGCGVEGLVWVSRNAPIANHTSFKDIRRGLSYGFELFWYPVCCDGGLIPFVSSYLNERNEIVCIGGLLGLPDLVICKSGQIFNSLVLQYFNALMSDFNAFFLFPTDILGLVICFVLFFSAVKCTCCGPCIFAFLIYKFRRRHLSAYDAIEDFLQNNNNRLMPVSYTYSQIRKMTCSFRDKLGEGGYGTVYKAKLRSGPLAAVKMLGRSSKSSSQDFVNEVSTIGRIHHVNVVQLIGYCAQGSKRALVYDFMPNGSLEKYIFPREDETVLFSLISWEKLYEISLGVARGIEYLHQGCHMQILHFDIKPHNILLDENFIPKISDFGLAKLYSTDDSIVSLTGIRGTMGYMAPELFYKNIGGISYKADVYSFGMLLMEMAGRRKNLNAFADHPSQIYFPTWAYEQLSCGKDIEIESGSEVESKLVKKMIMVALWCIQMKPSDRPSMSKVVEMLEEEDELPQMAPKPFLAPQEVPSEGVVP